jgi:hypothetical protein
MLSSYMVKNCVEVLKRHGMDLHQFCAEVRHS